MLKDIRFAFRALRRTPVLTTVVIASLALGIGVNTAIFSLIDQVLIRGLPVREPRRLVVFHTADYFPGTAIADNHESVFSYPVYRDLRDRSRVFDGVIARASARVSISSGGTSERAVAELVSGNYFQTLGVPALIGRTLLPSDDGAPGANPVVMLSAACWKARFGSNAAIVNRAILVNGHPMVVVGVVPPSFKTMVRGNAPELFAPISMQRQMSPVLPDLEDSTFAWLSVFGRLKPGVEINQARAASATVFKPVLEDLLDRMGPSASPGTRKMLLSMKLDLLPAAQGVNELRREFRTVLLVLMAMVVLVLVVACANVAGLLTARAMARRREIAVRLALGASRTALVRQLLVESVLLALAGGALGLLLARWSLAGLLQVISGGDLQDVIAASVDARLLAFNIVLSITTGILFGLVPAIQSTRARVAGTLKDQSVSTGSGVGQARFRRGLVMAQVAVSLVLLIGSGLMVKTVRNVLAVDPGFRTAQVLTFRIDPTLKVQPPERVHETCAEVQRRLRNVPGVVTVSAASPGPFTHSQRGANLTVEGYQAVHEGDEAGASIHAITPDYMRTISARLTGGRELRDADMVSAQKVALVNAAFEKKYGSGKPILGRHFAFGGGPKTVPDREIIGVVADFKHSDLREAVEPSVYVPYPQDDRPTPLTFYLKTSRDQSQLAPQIRRIVHDVGADLPLFDMKPMQEYIDEATATDRLLAILASSFGILSTLLAAIGLYGVIAFTVARRTQEIGVRMALGAVPRDVLRLVMKEVAVIVLVGVLVGVSCALASGQLVTSQLFGLSARDPVVFAGAATILALVAILAGVIPARRAAAIDPLRALRYE